MNIEKYSNKSSHDEVFFPSRLSKKSPKMLILEKLYFEQAIKHLRCYFIISLYLEEIIISYIIKLYYQNNNKLKN